MIDYKSRNKVDCIADLNTRNEEVTKMAFKGFYFDYIMGYDSSIGPVDFSEVSPLRSKVFNLGVEHSTSRLPMTEEELTEYMETRMPLYRQKTLRQQKVA